MDSAETLFGQAPAGLGATFRFVAAHAWMAVGAAAAFAIVLCCRGLVLQRGSRRKIARLEKQLDKVQEVVRRLESREDHLDMIAIRSGRALTSLQTVGSAAQDLRKMATDGPAAV